METGEIYLLLWRKHAEQTLGWGDSQDWNDIDFEKLSDRIFDKTTTRLSLSTLKRIFGKVQYSSSPAPHTLNVLARFSDFTDWRSFTRYADETQSANPGEKEIPSVKPLAPIPTPVKKRLSRNLLFAIGGLLLIAALVILAFKKSEKKGLLNKPVIFESRKVSDNLPNSVVFTYDATAFNSDSVYIQQTWDPTRVEKLPSQGKQHTCIYYWPGYFNAKLIIDGTIKKENVVFIKTKGWTGIIDKKPTPAYLDSVDIHLPGALGTSAATFTAKTGSPVFNDSWLFFYNIREFDSLDGQHFNFETVLRNTSTPAQSSCRKLFVYVIGTTNVVMAPLADKGCIATLDLFAGDHWIRGKENDLSAFGCDFNEFQRLAFSINNQQLNISLNSKHILTAPVKIPIGRIVGICIKSEGIAEIKSVQLDSPEKTVYREDF